jgi:multidrug efflux pump
MDINIFVQIGFVVLVGLASKNAILIVEFAKEKSAKGASPVDATVEACRLRLRPIIMTSLAFILGVVPLAIAVGAGRKCGARWESPSFPDVGRNDLRYLPDAGVLLCCREIDGHAQGNAS